MRQGQRIARGAALVFSIVLVSLYVYDRAGGDLLRRSSSTHRPPGTSVTHPALLPGSKRAEVWVPVEDRPQDATVEIAHGSQTLLPGSKSAAVWAPGDEPAQHAATPVRAAASRSPRPKSATIEKPSALAPELRRDARDGIAPELVSDPFAAPPAPPEMPQGEDDPFAAPQPEMYPAADDPFADEPEKAPDELIDPFDPPDAFRS